MKRTYRRPPCPRYDVEALESWLTDLASGGLLLCEDGFFCGFGAFDCTQPQAVRYRLDAAPKAYGPLSDGDGGPDDRQAELAAAFGWRYIARLGEFHIYRTDDPAAPELHTDPRVQAISLRLLLRRLRGSAACVLFWALLYPILMLRFQLLHAMLEVGTPFILAGLGLGLWSFLKALARTLHLRRLHAQLRQGVPLRHDKPWRRRAARHRAAGYVQAACWIAWLCVGLHLWSLDMMQTRWRPLGAEMPFATMADVVSEADCTQTEPFDVRNGYIRRSDPLARTVIRYREHAVLRAPDGRQYHGGLSVHYYKTRSALLARSLFWERQMAERLRARGAPETAPLPALPVDEAVCFRDPGSHFPVLVLRKGGTLLWAEFYQAGPDHLPLEHWAAALAEKLA